MQTANNDQPTLINDDLWEELIRLTNGSVALCYQCGACTANCPWGIVREDALSVRGYIRQAQLGIKNGDEGLWLCSSCGGCEVSCPRGVNISDIFRALRTLAWLENEPHRGLPSVLWSVFWNGNPWSQPPSQRSEWAVNTSLPVFDPQEHEILLYVGCTSSYDPRAQRIVKSLVKMFQAAEVSFGYLFDEEPCCGEGILSLGHQPYFEEIASRSAQLFQDKGVGQIVTVSPHSYHVFKNHYPSFNPEFEPIHYTQYLAELMDRGRLKFEHELNTTVTFQDPCYLGRHNGDYLSPRRVLNSIPGVDLVEMEAAKELALCCGGGGGRMWLETDPGERFSDLRVHQAQAAGADLLATACPFCVVCLEDSVKLMKDGSLEVMDIAEIASLALNASRNGE